MMNWIPDINNNIDLLSMLDNIQAIIAEAISEIEELHTSQGVAKLEKIRDWINEVI